MFVHPRSLKGSTTSNGTKAFRLQCIASLQRAVAVCPNSTGAFGALRVEYKPLPINVTGRCFSVDMTAIAPYIDEVAVSACQDTKIPPDTVMKDSSILNDIGEVVKLMAVIPNGSNQAESYMHELNPSGKPDSLSCFCHESGAVSQIPTNYLHQRPRHPCYARHSRHESGVFLELDFLTYCPSRNRS